MVSVGVSFLGRTSIALLNQGKNQRDVLLKEDLLPEIRELSEFYIFQQDGAPAHRAREMAAILTNETPDFMNPTLWPPNSQELNPVDYKIWRCLGNKWCTKQRSVMWKIFVSESCKLGT